MTTALRLRDLLWLAVLPVGVVGALVLTILAVGQDPGAAFSEFFGRVLGSRAGMGEVAARAAVLTFYALGIALSFRAGQINIGAEGQSRVGAAAGTALTVGASGVFFERHSWIGMLAMLLAGAAAGAVWSLIAGVLKQWRQVPEVVATLMLNFVAQHWVRYMIGSHAWLQGSTTTFQKNVFPVPLQFKGWAGTEFHSGIFLIVPAALAAHVFLFHTAGGLHLRAMGLNRTAARAAGVACERISLGVFAAAGALAGLAGSMSALAAGQLEMLPPYSDFGYMAVSAALVAGLRPIWIVPTAILFAAMDVGASAMETARVPHWVVFFLNGLLILAILARDALRRREGDSWTH